MEFLSAVVRRFTGASERSAPQTYGGTWETILGGSARSSFNAANLLEANREWVFIAVDLIAKSMAGIRFKVMSYAKSGDDQEIFEGPLVDFLEKPSVNFTGKDFIYLNAAYMELAGNAFWEIQKDKTVRPLIPTRIKPIVENGVITGYRYTGDGTERTIQVKDVLHDRYLDPARPWWGKGKLERIARWIDTATVLPEFLNRYFSNGASFGGFIETEEETEARIKLIKAGLANDHQGVDNAHKWAVLPKGSKATPNLIDMSKLEMGSTDDRYRDKILSAFGVPKQLVGLAEQVQRGNVEAGEYIFAKYTLKPIADDFVEFLNVNVAPIFDTTGRQYFAYDEFIPEDQQSQVEERKAALANQPYKTVNEVRAEVGLPPTPDGDVIYVTQGMVPLGTEPPEPIAPVVQAPANDNEPVKEEPKKALPRRARASFGTERMVDGIAKAFEIVTAHHDADEESHKSFVSRVESHEELVADKVRDFNNQQERDVVSRLNHIVKAVKRSDVFDLERDMALLVDFVGPMLKGLMIEQAIAEYQAQGFKGVLDQTKPTIRKTVEKAAQRMAKSYNKTTAKLLANTLNTGIENGETIPDLTRRVQQVYEFSNVSRAATVATSESFYIANEGSREAYRQSGVVRTIRWYTALDEKVCEWCGPEDGRVIDIEEDFYSKGTTITGSDGGILDLDYRGIDVPPLHPNCRCFIRPEEIAIS